MNFLLFFFRQPRIIAELQNFKTIFVQKLTYFEEWCYSSNHEEFFPVKHYNTIKVTKRSTPFFPFQYTIQSDSATVGQQLLDLKYKNDRQAKGIDKWMSGNQKTLFAVCTVLGPWLSDRIPNITSRVRNSPHEQQVR